MTNKELIVEVAKRSGKNVTQAMVRDILANTAMVVSEEVRKGTEKVTVTGFGTVNVKDVPARKGKCNGKVWSKSAGKKVTFGLASAIKKSVS